MSITTELQLRQFLSSKDIPCHEVKILSGGTANFCWRVTTLLGRRSIIKHAEAYVRSMPNFKLPVERMDYEHLALTIVPGFIPEDEHVLLPEVYHYFPEEHVLDMFDGGSRTLKESYIEDDTINVSQLGQKIGTWLARLHKSTSEPETLQLVREKLGNSPGKSIYRYTYNGLASVLENFGYDRGLGERINEQFGSKLETDEVCLCHGDCWPGNFLVEDQDQNPAETVEGVEEKPQAPTLTLVDWELVRVGNGATDVGQFTAESWLLDRFHGGKGLLEAFLSAYLAERPLSDADKIRVAAHSGVHITFYPPMVNWTDEEGTKELVRIGKGILEAVDANDVDKLKTGPLKPLFS
jgi:thiamine kinase-like enzyme